MDEAVEPLMAVMRDRGIDYRGVLYAGLMLGPDGAKVLEYNVRFGDPETQVVLPLLVSDAAELFMATATGRLGTSPPGLRRWFRRLCRPGRPRLSRPPADR